SARCSVLVLPFLATSSFFISVLRFLLLVRCFFLRRPPPRFPLFPYTTLFRSQVCLYLSDALELNIVRALQLVDRVSEVETRSTRDRKSTRLNSSHQIISYAVFCLKKKKKNTHTSIGANMQYATHVSAAS